MAKKVRIYGNWWDADELAKAQKDLDRWTNALMQGTPPSKIPKTSKSALRLSRQAHDAI